MELKGLPDGYEAALARAFELASDVEGLLKDSEIRALFLFGSCPTAEGKVLEIGSFRGRSAVVLSKATELAGEPGIVAVDPLTSPSKTDPDLGGESSGRHRFHANLKRAGVSARVEFHEMPSIELAASWDRPIRFLWIDGDHTHEGAHRDLSGFSPFLTRGAMVAMHDVMHRFDGPIRVFIEDVLSSDDFGPCGVVGSTGWARYLGPGEGAAYRGERASLSRKLGRLLPYQLEYDRPLGWLGTRLYRLWKSLVPHGDLDPVKWLERVERQ